MSSVASNIASSLLGPDGWAYLDWVSGLIRINATYQELESMRKYISGRERFRAFELPESQVLHLETLTHEYAHYFQLCTTGYLYRLAKKLYTTVTDSLPRNITAAEELPQSVIDDLGPKLDAIKRESLLAVGANGLNVLSVIESAAFLIQKRYHQPALSPEEYEQALAGQQGIYGEAYDYAVEHLGSVAFITYPLLASLSLWTSSPVDSLVRLCTWFRNLSSAERNEVLFGHLVGIIANQPGFIGPPWTVGRRDFPEYEASIRYLDSAQTAGHFDRQAYLTHPYRHEHEEVMVRALPPVILNAQDKPGAVAIQWPLSWDEKSQEAKVARSDVLLLLFAVSTHIQRRHTHYA